MLLSVTPPALNAVTCASPRYKLCYRHCSIILLDIPIRLVEQLCILVQLKIEQRLAQCLFDFALAGAGGLPAGETNQAHDLIDFGNEPLDDDRCLRRAHLFKEFGQGRFAPVFVFFGGRIFFGLEQIDRLTHGRIYRKRATDPVQPGDSRVAAL